MKLEGSEETGRSVRDWVEFGLCRDRHERTGIVLAAIPELGFRQVQDRIGLYAGCYFRLLWLHSSLEICVRGPQERSL